MTWPERCAAVVPCLNEAGSIAPLVREIRTHLPAVFVVDDGSADATAREAAAAGAVVLRHARPMGKGVSLRAGFAATLQRGYGWALALDGDGQHAPADIPAFLSKADEGALALIIGNRMSNPAGMPLLRQMVNRWMSRTISDFCGVAMPDTQCGFRLVNLAAWSTFQYRATHFEFESELLVRFACAGFAVRFVPIATRYGSERSKIRPLQDTLRWFRWWRAIRQELRPGAPGPAAVNSGETSGESIGASPWHLPTAPAPYAATANPASPDSPLPQNAIA